MNRSSIFVTVLSLLLLIFLVTTLYQIRLVEDREAQLVDMDARMSLLQREIEQIDEQNVELQRIILNLTAQTVDLQESNSQLDSDVKEIGQSYDELQNETNELLESIDSYEAEIERTIEWYKSNAVLDSSNEQKAVKRKVNINCVKVGNDECRIKLGCFYLVNQEFLDIEYKSDFEETGKIDKLLSLGDFLDSNGGDCEDYSLFYKAQVNHAIELCEDKPIVFEAWAHPTEHTYNKYWVNFQESWYIKGVEEFDIEGYPHPSIICGNLYDPVKKDLAGHCMIAFSKEPIENVGDISLLSSAVIVEPQDGSFRGYIDEPSSGVSLITIENFNGERYPSYIYTVITDSDYYLYSESQGDWQSYSSFLEKLELAQEKILS